MTALPFLMPHVKYLEGESRGYVLLDVTAKQVQAVKTIWNGPLRRRPTVCT